MARWSISLNSFSSGPLDGSVIWNAPGRNSRRGPCRSTSRWITSPNPATSAITTVVSCSSVKVTGSLTDSAPRPSSSV